MRSRAFSWLEQVVEELLLVTHVGRRRAEIGRACLLPGRGRRQHDVGRAGNHVGQRRRRRLARARVRARARVAAGAVALGGTVAAQLVAGRARVARTVGPGGVGEAVVARLVGAERGGAVLAQLRAVLLLRGRGLDVRVVPTRPDERRDLEDVDRAVVDVDRQHLVIHVLEQGLEAGVALAARAARIGLGGEVAVVEVFEDRREVAAELRRALGELVEQRDRRTRRGGRLAAGLA